MPKLPTKEANKFASKHKYIPIPIPIPIPLPIPIPIPIPITIPIPILTPIPKLTPIPIPLPIPTDTDTDTNCYRYRHRYKLRAFHIPLADRNEQPLEKLHFVVGVLGIFGRLHPHPPNRTGCTVSTGLCRIPGLAP